MKNNSSTKQFLFSVIAFGFVGSVAMQLFLSVQTGGIRVAGKHIQFEDLNNMGVTASSSPQEIEKAQNSLIDEGEAEDSNLVANPDDVEKLSENFKLSKKKFIELGIPVSAPLYIARNEILTNQLFGPTQYVRYNQEDMHTFASRLLSKRSGYYIELDSEADWDKMYKELGNFESPSDFCEAKGFTKVTDALFTDFFKSSCNNCSKSSQCYSCIISDCTCNECFNLGTSVAENIERISAIQFVKTAPGTFTKYVQSSGECYVVFITNITPPAQEEIDRFSEHANKLLNEENLKESKKALRTYKSVRDRQRESNL